MGRKKLLLAGSHAGATGIALVQQIIKEQLPWDIIWLGKKWATEDKNSHTFEYNHLPSMGVKFYEFESGRIQTKFTKHTLLALIRVPLGFILAGYYLLKIKPDLILTFGGAAGAEASFWGSILGIPVIVHEQTAVAGRANLFSARFAKKIAISRDSSRNYFDARKTVLTGNPINQEIINLRTKPNGTLKNIFVTGGSRGAVKINNALVPILPKLLKEYKVVLQAGEENLSKVKIKNTNFKVYGQLSPKDWVEELSKADLVISRAGANVVSELIAFKKPAIFIPIPWSYLDEQTKNAEYAVSLGAYRILPQEKLSPQSLEEEIEFAFKNYDRLIEHASRRMVSPDTQASEKLVKIISEYINENE